MPGPANRQFGEVWVFGSRSSGHARPTSDLDLVLLADEPFPFAVLAELNEDFAESDLPFKVDVLQWLTLREEFRGVVRSRCQLFRRALAGSTHPKTGSRSQGASDFRRDARRRRLH